MIIKSGFGTIINGKNKSFCFILKKDGRYTDLWRNWWLDFSKFKSTSWQGTPFTSITRDDYNYLVLGISTGLLIVKPEQWEEIEVSFFTFLIKIKKKKGFGQKTIFYLQIGNIFLFLFALSFLKKLFLQTLFTNF